MKRLVFDIGGTNMRIALADKDALGEIRKLPTPKDPATAIEALGAFLAERDVQLTEAVGGVAGMVREGVVISAPHLPLWDGVDFGRAVTERTGVPVRLFNDAEIAGIGEAVEGAGKGHAAVAYLTIGTGVGGTMIFNGKALPQGTEPGRQVIDYPNLRTLESFVGGAALLKEFGVPSEELPRSILAERTLPLAVGIYNAVRHWAPDIVVLNGALMNEETGFKIADVMDALARLAPPGTIPPLTLARFRDDSGLHGSRVIR